MTANPCPHARSAAEFITSRAVMGVEKYGHTLADAGLSPAALVRHAREEAADLLVYLTGLEDGMPNERSVADRMRDPKTQADEAMERAQRSGDETAAATWAVASAVFALRDTLTPARVERSGYYECLSDKPSGTWDDAFKPEPTAPEWFRAWLDMEDKKEAVRRKIEAETTKPEPTRTAVTREAVMEAVAKFRIPRCLHDRGDCLAPEKCPCAQTVDAIMALIVGAP